MAQLTDNHPVSYKESKCSNPPKCISLLLLEATERKMEFMGSLLLQ